MKTATAIRPTSFLPYGKQCVRQSDVEAVLETLQSDWLTQGPAVPAFERDLSRYTGAEEAVVCSSGTAALHLALLAAGIGPGDQVLTSAISFVASANAAQYVGAETLFADTDSETAALCLTSVERLVRADKQRKIKAIIPVHFAGQAVDLKALSVLARSHGAIVIDDACHALGGSMRLASERVRVGGNPHADMTVFSFHPVKHITTGEGGAVVTSDGRLAERLRILRTHGIRRDQFVDYTEAYDSDESVNPWYYEMTMLGYNYRMTDLQAALGRTQMTSLDASITRRREIARLYHSLLSRTFAPVEVTPLADRDPDGHAWHLYVVRVDFDRFGVTRGAVMQSLKRAGIGTQVHYIPIPMQPYYRSLGHDPSLYPRAVGYYRQALSLPMYPELSDADIQRVVAELKSALGR